MNSEKLNSVADLLHEIQELLLHTGEAELARVFASLERKSRVSQDCLIEVRALFGGMGSFNDLVLHRDGIPLEKENEQLNSYRRALFEKIYE